MHVDTITRLDQAVIAAARNIQVLSALAWPAGADERFLSDWRRGLHRLPEVQLRPPDLREHVETLDAITQACDLADPVQKFLGETARSYANAGRMVMNVGSSEFTRYSMKIYGRPDMVYKLQGITAVDGARYFLDITDRLLGNPKIEAVQADIPAGEFAAWLQEQVDAFFVDDRVEVALDPTLSAKALAGSTRIRVRADALFSQLDKDQLLFHEAFVHTATQLNGQKQPHLKSLGLGAPRTTRTQEGMAVLAELITNAIDLPRLRRVALRVIGVKMALDGADFIDLFRFFLEAGQSEIESVKSAQRIFRGGATRGGVVFTKDAVYLQGLIEVHTFLRMAIRDNQPELVRNLFAGRLTMADALRMNALFESGWLAPPAYLPAWAADLGRLAAMMAFSAFITNIDLDVVRLHRMLELEEEIMDTANC